MKNGHHHTDDTLLDQLRALLLTEDRAAVRRLEDVLHDPDKLSEKVLPLVEPQLESRLEFLKQNFPKEYRAVVDKLIEERIQNSQEQIVEAIYPLLGSMVRKFIEHQFQQLKESIEARLDEMRARMNFWKRLKSRLAGVSEAELLLAASDVPTVEEIFLVERNSGLLLAHAARRTNLDRDAVAGMLTAIKAFVEDAFRREREELDYISYDHYKILVQNYRTYFVAALVEGSISARERGLLESKLQEFILQEFQRFSATNDDERYREVSAKLEAWFMPPDETPIQEQNEHPI